MNREEHALCGMPPTFNAMSGGTVSQHPPGAVVPASMFVTHGVLVGFGLAELAEGYRIS